MSRDDAISWEHTLGVLPFLDQLQLGFVLIDPAGSLVHLSYIARRMLGRRARIARVAEVLGDAWPALVDDVIAGRSPGGRWRELRAPGADDGDELLVAARSTAVTQADGRVGVLVSLFDVSAEVGMHARYKDALAQLEAANQGLRRRIAEVLREHEDDLAQFDELLAIAPAIFASFVAEAREAVAEVAALVGGDTLSAAAADVGMRATHTLKGNARGLGLNSIAGRAHAVEELLGRARAAGRFADRVDADGAVEDLRRAVERAVVLRGRLTEVGDGGGGLELTTTIADAAGRLEDALAELAPDHPARRHVRDALAAIDPLGRVPLGQLFEYLRVTARTAAEAAAREVPDVEHVGGAIAVPPSVHAALAQALPHLVRNAVVHGLEPAAARIAAGKPAAGTIRLEAREDGGELRVRLEDDGRGLDHAALAARAVELGVLPAAAAATPAALDQLIFHPGLSTAAGVTMDAGRGYGNAAARADIEALGGRLEVRSTPGQGVVFELAVPLGVVKPARPAPG